MTSKRRKNRNTEKIQPDNNSLDFSRLNQAFSSGKSMIDINLPNIKNSLKTMDKISKGLDLVTPSQEFLKNYNHALNLQNSIVEQAKSINGILNSGVKQMNVISSDIIAPISVNINNVGIIASDAKQSFELGKIDESIFKSTQLLSDSCVDILQEQQGILFSKLQDVKNIEDLGKLAIETSPSLNMVSSGLTEVIRSVPLFPYTIDSPKLRTFNQKELLVETETEIDSEIIECQKKLDDILLLINPELVEYRRGCWKTFNKKTEDYIGQSSSSMRRLIDKLLRTIAPKKDVTKTNYFKNNKKAKNSEGQPTRVARVYYLLNYDKDQAKRFKRLTRGFLSAYDNLPTWDHEPLKHNDFVHGVFITIEGYLLSLLSEWRKKE
jgi:hypothetical protein